MKLVIGNEVQREMAQQVLDRLDLSRGSYVVEVLPKGKPVSSQQHGLYRRWCAIFANFSGHTPEEIHQEFLARFLIPVEKEIRGRIILDRSTTDLTTETMSLFMTRCQALAAEMGCMLE